MKYCQIINLPIKEFNNSNIPILMVKNKIDKMVLEYIKDLYLQGKSQSTLKKHISSIALLWDYYLTFEKYLLKEESKNILKLFIDKRINGTLKYNEIDETLLNWKSVSIKTVKIDILNITSYFEFTELNYNSIPLNIIQKQLHTKVNKSLAVNKSLNNRFFNFMEDTQLTKKIKIFDRKDSYGKHITSEYKAFPHEKVDNLIEVSNLRNKLIFILLAYGGCRSSELLHLYINDVELNTKNQTANIYLSNPVEGIIEWSKKGVEKRGKRKEYLKDKYNLEPRNLLSNTNSLYSGWKSMTEDDGIRHISNIYWSNPEMGRLFYKLHLKYMKIRLKENQNHPYYFISLNKENFGEPLTMNALKSLFKSHIKKIGLDTKEPGVNLHGLRHFYGYYCANKLKVSKEIAQRMLHHKSIESTEIYYQKTIEIINEELENGYKRIRQNG